MLRFRTLDYHIYIFTHRPPPPPCVSAPKFNRVAIWIVNLTLVDYRLIGVLVIRVNYEMAAEIIYFQNLTRVGKIHLFVHAGMIILEDFLTGVTTGIKFTEL